MKTEYYKPRLTPTAKKRLLRLSRALLKNADNKKGMRFDLATVLYFNPKSRKAKEPGLNCGTAGCAIGLAAISGMFIKDGLKTDIIKDACGDGNYGFRFSIHYRNKVGFGSATELFFGLTVKEHEYLFTPEYYKKHQIGARGERYVAKRIKDFVAGRCTADEVKYGEEGSYNWRLLNP